jgi:PKD repeat protein
MKVERSLQGTARAQVIGPTGKFTELNASVENYTVIVPTDVNITFSAEESTDPNSPDGRVSPDSNFTWTFTNETFNETVNAYGIKPEVTFEVMGNYTGNLTIVETGGNATYRNFTLFVDGLAPIARIENNVTGLGSNATNTTITIKEGARVRFFGGNSTDMVHDEMVGEIRDWQWDFDGDGKVDATGETVDWTFSDPGNFTVNLTVVDQAGKESVNATMWVVVEDITSPTVEFNILDSDFREATSIVEGKKYYFDASDTTDNFDDLEDMTFEWDFGDGGSATGVNVTHVFEEYGNYEVVLNVTDTAGNMGNATKKLVVEVDAKSRPDLEIETGSLKIDPSSPEESTFFGAVIVTIRLNVTNKEGRAPAEDVQVTFWAFRSGEDPGDPIPIDPVFKDMNGTPTDNKLQPGEKKTVEFTWATGPLGNYTLRVNVTDSREPDLFVGPRNTAEMQIDVREAGWKRPVLIAAIVGVIAGIPVAIYVRRKYRGRVKERITKK